MEIELIAPCTALEPYVRVFYRARSEQAETSGLERVDLGQLRFWLKGGGTLVFADGTSASSRTVSISGPGMAVRGYRGTGEFDCFGAALRPMGWGSFIRRDARSIANRLLEGEDVFGDPCAGLLSELRGLGSSKEMVRALEAFLLPRIKPLPRAHVRLIEQVHAWEGEPRPVIESLYAGLDMSPRQIARLINQYYGGPPKFLERKFRAMRAAVRIARGEDPAQVAELFYDQPHMIRELKRFVGYTPKALRENNDPVLLAALALERFT